MGDAVQLKCTKCKAKYPPGKFPFLFVGRGLESKTHSLPAYCGTCKKFMSIKAEKPYCPTCNNIVELLGDFTVMHEERSRLKRGTFDYWYPWELLSDNPWGLTIGELIESSEISDEEKELFKINPDIIDEYVLIFKVNLKEKYHCPNCNEQSIKVSMALVSWD